MTTISDIYVIDGDSTVHYNNVRGNELEYTIIDGLLIVTNNDIDGTASYDTYKNWDSVSATVDEDEEAILRVIHDEA